MTAPSIGLATLPAVVRDWVSNDTKYDRYFQHYQEMQRWMGDYVSSMKRPTRTGHPYQISGSHRFEPNYSSHVPRTVPHASPHTSRDRKSTHKKTQSKHGRNKSHGNPPHHRDSEEQEMDWSEGGDGQGAEENFVLEVSQEMKEFFAKSEDFRRRREEAKQSGQLFNGQTVTSGNDAMDRQESNQRNDDAKMTVDMEIQLKTSAPKERPGVRRIAEMKQLYGRHAATIHGMETAIQLQFDRNCDRKQSAYWPIVPLKM